MYFFKKNSKLFTVRTCGALHIRGRIQQKKQPTTIHGEAVMARKVNKGSVELKQRR